MRLRPERARDRSWSRARRRAGVYLLAGVACAAIGSCKGEKPGPPPRESGGTVNPAFHRDVRPGTPVSPGSTRLGKFVVEEATQGWGRLQLNLSVTGNPLSIGGQGYDSGLGTHAVSRIKIAFGPKFKVFSGSCGVDDWVGNDGSIVFRIDGDSKALFTSPVMKGGMKAVDFTVPVAGLSSLILVAENRNPGVNGDHADWVNLSLK